MCGLNEVIWFVRIPFSKAMSIELVRVPIPEVPQYGLRIPFPRMCCSQASLALICVVRALLSS